MYIKTSTIRPHFARHSSGCIGGSGFSIGVNAATGVCQEIELAPLVTSNYCSYIYCLYCFLNKMDDNGKVKFNSSEKI